MATKLSRAKAYCSTQLRKRKLTALQCRRLFKAALGTTICFILTLIAPVAERYGSASYLLYMISVNNHPGRRFGAQLEVCVMSISGATIGIGYSCLCRFIAKLVDDRWGLRNALAFLAVAEIVMLFVHGFFRSYSPRLLPMVVTLFIVSHFSFLTSLDVSLAVMAKEFSAPIFTSIGVALCVSLTVFPEFGSSFLGGTAISSIENTQRYLTAAVETFLSNTPRLESIKKIEDERVKIRSSLNSFQTTLTQCQFEVSFSFMAPYEVKPLLKRSVQIENCLNGVNSACHSAFLLTGSTIRKVPTVLLQSQPIREIERGDIVEFRHLLDKARAPVIALATRLNSSMEGVKEAIRFCYQKEEAVDNNVFQFFVKKTLEGHQVNSPKKELELLSAELMRFDSQLSSPLYNSVTDEDHGAEFVPKDEFFLVSSFILNMRQIANETCNMLVDADRLLEICQRRKDKGNWRGKSFWISSFGSRKTFMKYLSSGNAADLDYDDDAVSLLNTHTKAQKDDEALVDSQGLRVAKLPTKIERVIADGVDLIKRFSDNIKFALKFCTILMIVSFPAFIPSLTTWYAEVRGSWVGFVCMVMMETSIGAANFTYIMRAIGMTAGSAWGMVVYETGTGRGGRYVMIVPSFLGALAGFYVILFTSQNKTGVVALVASGIIPLATLYPVVPGGIVENFAKRCLAAIIGGAVSMFVHHFMFPVRARDLLEKQVVKAISCCQQLESLQYVSGRDKNMVKVWKKAKTALTTASGLVPLTRQEIRLKGSYRPIVLVLKEIIFVTRQILDRYYNLYFLAQHTNILFENNADVRSYRRDLYGCLSNSFQALESALKTKQPLPQFLPSARIANLRLVNKIREMLMSENPVDSDSDDGDKMETESAASSGSAADDRANSNWLLRKDRAEFRRKVMAWSATASAMEEIVEYVEYLCNLTKQIAGSYEFKYGFLARSLDDDNAIALSVMNSRNSAYEDDFGDLPDDGPIRENSSESNE